MTNLTIAVNADTQDEIYGASAVDWIDLVTATDKLIFSDETDAVKDGETIPSEAEYNQAGTLISAIADVEVDKCFLEDTDAGLLKEIHNFGANKQYVFACIFDGAVASEPVLELFDDDELDSIDLFSLGNGIASNSWWRGVVTTDRLPGVDWAGDKLAGDAEGHFLYLNDEDGAFAVAKNLYFNLKVIIPAGTENSGLELPVFCVKYTTN